MIQHLILDGVTMGDVPLLAFPYASSPVLKRQTIDIPGADGLLDLTIREVYNERSVSVAVSTLSESRKDSILSKQGKMVKLSTTQTWLGKHWQGRLSIPKYVMWGAEHRIFLSLSAMPYLMNDALSASAVVTATTAGAPVSLSVSRLQTPEAVVTGTVQFITTQGSATRSYTLTAGTHRLTGLVVGGGTVLSGSVKGTGTLQLRARDGELWIG